MSLQLASAAARSGEVEPIRLLEIAGRQVTHLDRMIGDLLDVARAHAGKLPLQLSLHDLRDVVREVVDLFRASGESPALEVQLPSAPVIARCDPTRMTQVVTNLVSNALKYSPSGPKVDIRLEGTPEGPRLEVVDHGVGIDQAELPHLFEPFRRGSALRHAIAGAGMGLYVTRRIVEGHGGRIEVASEPGRGSTFTVWLPPAERATGLQEGGGEAPGA
jgi:signal transduction histidine kinase